MTIEKFASMCGNQTTAVDINRLLRYRDRIDAMTSLYTKMADLIYRRANAFLYLVSVGVSPNQSIAFSILYYTYRRQDDKMVINQDLTLGQIESYARVITNPFSLGYLITVNDL